MSLYSFLFGPDNDPSLLANAPTTAAEVMRCTDLRVIADCMRHHDGYLREAALARAAALGAAGLAPAMVERLNDWAPPVRDAARGALLTLLPSMSGTALLALLPATLALGATGRIDHTAWIDQFEHALVAKSGAQDLVTGAHGKNPVLARACFQVLQKYYVAEARALAAVLILSRTDIALAKQALALCNRLPEYERRAAYLAALASPFGAVRTVALSALLRSHADATHDTLALSLLMDPQSSVRETAMSYLATRQVDARAHYRALLDEGTLSAKSIQVALMSLARLQDRADVPRARHFSASALPSVRRAALSAWIKLAPDQKDDVALAALDDERPSVRLFSRQAVNQHGAYLPFTVVTAMWQRTNDTRLFLSHAEHGKWDWLEGLARIAAANPHGDEQHAILVASLRDWSANSGKRYDAPTAQQRAFLTSQPATLALATLWESAPTIHAVVAMELGQISGLA